MWKNSYVDYFECPKCGNLNAKGRNRTSIGKVVLTFCLHCRKATKVLANNQLPLELQKKIWRLPFCNQDDVRSEIGNFIEKEVADNSEKLND